MAELTNLLSTLVAIKKESKIETTIKKK